MDTITLEWGQCYRVVDAYGTTVQFIGWDCASDPRYRQWTTQGQSSCDDSEHDSKEPVPQSDEGYALSRERLEELWQAAIVSYEYEHDRANRYMKIAGAYKTLFEEEQAMRSLNAKQSF